MCVKQFSVAVSLILRVLSCGCVCGERDLSSTLRQEFKYFSWQFMRCLPEDEEIPIKVKAELNPGENVKMLSVTFLL